MIISKVILGVSAMLLILSASLSWGFEKQAHIEISKAAIELYKGLYPQKSKHVNESFAMFINGAGAEDDITIDLQRLLNWHFYDPGSRLGHAWWGARKSNTNRFKHLGERLIKSKAKGLPDTYEIAGRLAHHIQDMSSPPHTVPVYHTSDDPFDKYATKKIPGIKLTSDQIDAAKNEKRNLDVENMRKLLKDAATRTIGRVEKPVIFEGRFIASDWTGFWRKFELAYDQCGQKPHESFGCYGKHTFGVPVRPFTKPVYDRFYEEQIASAIEDTLRLLILFDRGGVKK